jgi:DNA-binding transcriptional ArsR family regulator
MTPDELTLNELAAEIAELRARIEAIEETPRRPAGPRPAITDLVGALRELLATEGDPQVAAGAVLYAGLGPRGDGEVAWQMSHSWTDVLAADRARTSRPLAALSSPARLDIISELLAGPVSRQELQQRLDRSTAGQLNHHLRELLAAGLVAQPRRGVYEVSHHRVVPILTLLSCAVDLASDSGAD